MKQLLGGLILVLCGLFGAAGATDNLKAFPLPESGQVRFILNLPPQTDEASFKVELIAGKTVLLEPANRYFFAGKIEEETIKGWGYPRFVVKGFGPMAGTLMAVDPDVPKVERFISLAGNPLLVRYNSRLPIVVYAPEGVEIRYRLWTAEPTPKPVPRQP